MTAALNPVRLCLFDCDGTLVDGRREMAGFRHFLHFLVRKRHREINDF